MDQCKSVCIRCGKQRVVVKTVKEYMNTSWVYTTITACPDAACQKLVDAILNKEQVVRHKIIENQEREKVLRDKRRKRSHRKKSRIINGRVPISGLQKKK